MFKEEKIHFIIYSRSLNNRAKDYKKQKVLFMTSQEDQLIAYVRNYLSRIQIAPPTPSKLARNSDSLKQIAQKLEDFLADKRNKNRPGLPKFGKSPVRVDKSTDPDFLGSTAKNPGPGAYSPEKNIRGKSTNFGH